MQCPACGSDSPDTAIFCIKCGTKLVDDKPKASEAVSPTGPARKAEAPAKGSGLSVASLVLGILSVFPFSILTGIPAAITGAIAIAQKRRGRGMAIAGVVLGASTPLTAGIILAIMIPNFVMFQERARRSTVKNNMDVVQCALEAYAVDHNDNYPGPDVSWEPGNGQGMAAYFPGGDPVGSSGSPVAGVFPLNPYSGERYRYGNDLFFVAGALAPSQNALVRGSDQGCPYRELQAPGGLPGTIVILGHAALAQSGTKQLQEYGIAGFAREVDEPLHDVDPAVTSKTDKDYHVYYVLHN